MSLWRKMQADLGGRPSASRPAQAHTTAPHPPQPRRSTPRRASARAPAAPRSLAAARRAEKRRLDAPSSVEVQEILSTPPRWIVRWGTGAVATVFAFFVIIAAGLRYPEVVRTQVTVLSENPPVPVVARKSGRVTQLWVQDQVRVRKGQPLAVLASTAQSRDVVILAQQLAQLQLRFAATAFDSQSSVVKAFASGARVPTADLPLQDKEGPTLAQGFNPHANLGELQERYAAFLGRLSDLEHFEQTQQYARQIEALEQAQRGQRQLSGALQRGRRLRQQGAAISDAWVARDRALSQQEVIAAREAEQAQVAHLDRLAAGARASAAALQSRVEAARTAGATAALAQEFLDRRQHLRRALRQSLQHLRAGLQRWEKKHVLRAPVAGRVQLAAIWAVQQYAKQGSEVMRIVPPRQRLIGRIQAEQRGLGRVRQGQKVRVQLLSYPAEQFGYVEGRVRRVSLAAEDHRFTLILDFPRGLSTHYGRKLPFKQGLVGQADIITQRMSLLQRMLYPLRYLWSTTVT